MARCKRAITVLLVALLASNAWWAYRLVDAGVSRTYVNAALDDNRIALAQVIAVSEESARLGANRDSMIAAAASAAAAASVAADAEPFEKDGYLWIDRIGLKFDQEGRLIDVERAWSPP